MQIIDIILIVITAVLMFLIYCLYLSVEKYKNKLDFEKELTEQLNCLFEENVSLLKKIDELNNRNNRGEVSDKH